MAGRKGTREGGGRSKRLMARTIVSEKFIDEGHTAGVERCSVGDDGQIATRLNGVNGAKGQGVVVDRDLLDLQSALIGIYLSLPAARYLPVSYLMLLVLQTHSTFGSRNRVGFGSRMEASSNPLAWMGDRGTTTFRPAAPRKNPYRIGQHAGVMIGLQR